jgi:hypothetical protein
MMFFAAALAKARAARSTECNITEPSAGRSDQGLPLGQLRLLLVFTNLRATSSSVLDVDSAWAACCRSLRHRCAAVPTSCATTCTCVSCSPSSQPRAQPVSRSWFAVRCSMWVQVRVSVSAPMLQPLNIAGRAPRPCFVPAETPKGHANTSGAHVGTLARVPSCSPELVAATSSSLALCPSVCCPLSAVLPPVVRHGARSSPLLAAPYCPQLAPCPQRAS